jgi:hypothetical protein
MDRIMDIIIKIVAILLSAGIAYVGKLAVAWIRSKLDAQQAEKLDKLIAKLVAAAEQLLYESDDTGRLRREYVIKELSSRGYEITDSVYSALESKVFEINLVKHGFEEQDDGGN